MESCANEVWKFVLCGYLPTVSECVQAILSVSPTLGSSKQNDASNEFCGLLIEQWEKAFGPQYVQCRKTVKKKFDKHLKDYVNQVSMKRGNRNVNMRRWMKENHKLLGILKDVDVKTFEEPEQLYYDDQRKLRRKRFLTGEVDEKYVIEEEERIKRVEAEFGDLSSSIESQKSCILLYPENDVIKPALITITTPYLVWRYPR